MVRSIRPEQWLILIFVPGLVALAAWKTAQFGTTADAGLEPVSTISPDIQRPAPDQAARESTTILAFADIAKCKPNSMSDYVKYGLNFVSEEGVIFDGVAEGASQTSRLAAQFPDADILAPGDLAYPYGSYLSYKYCFEKYFGTALDRFYPVPGNHDYKKSPAKGYFDYWGKRAGPRGKGYYSMDRGAWHIVALNSELEAEANSAQAEWLKADLSKTSAQCILAFYHRPTFTSRERGSGSVPQLLFRILYDYGATLILNGHNHFYERTAALSPDASRSPGRGIRTFVVGMGGANMPYGGQPAPFTDALITKTWGVLKLDLKPNAYSWEFISAPRGAVKDSGDGSCVIRPTPVPVTARVPSELVP